MEPRPHERGKWRRRDVKLKLPKAASMEPRPHERGKILREETGRRRKGGFNGATSSRTWKAITAFWQRLGIKRASMEPRPHERGKIHWPFGS